MPTSRKSAEPVHLLDVRTQGHFVLVPAADYAVVAPLFERQEPMPEETLAIVEAVAIDAGWLDPTMDAYDHYTSRSRRPKV